MMNYLTDSSFRELFADEKLHLPIRWDGGDFANTLNSLLKHYVDRIEKLMVAVPRNAICLGVDIERLKIICGFIQQAANQYLNGFPSKAFNFTKECMILLMKKPLKVYYKSISEHFSYSRKGSREDRLNLFRATCVPDNKAYDRTRVFHTPYTMRSKVSTSRYSIAGYPSLYLGTSLELCCEEIHMNPHNGYTLASMFKLERRLDRSRTRIEVIELGIKPQDFLSDSGVIEGNKRSIAEGLLEKQWIREAYLLWYPLIASCSYT